MKNNSELCGERVTLRIPTRDNLSYIQSLWSDPETMSEVGGVHIYSNEEIDKWYDRIIINGADKHLYFIIYNENDIPVGEISFHDHNRFNVKVSYSHRRNGYFKEATVLFLRHFFEVLGADEITDDIALENTVSHQLFLTLGFEHLPQHKDVFFVRMTNEQFKQAHG